LFAHNTALHCPNQDNVSLTFGTGDSHGVVKLDRGLADS
jgi:hypothetical protein